ncbi:MULTISPECIES: S41 family peptidase [unclassified Streptococcus]|uniref:S41 family peptidase n=1 Tax=unclassified Streptococcus TaxID=2608887 RepID=UPI00066FF385|nr:MULTISPECIES: S41 family peptidase [unclassified Streptococcus]
MSDDEFLYLAKTYLASFGILSHVGISYKSSKPYGFALRKHKDALYVTRSLPSTNLIKGDKITHIEGLIIEDVYQKHVDFFTSKKAERQFQEWAYLVKHAAHITLIRDGEKRAVQVAEPVDSEHIGKKFDSYYLNEQTYYMKIENFMDEVDIMALYDQAFPKLEKVENLIIDVRVNNGGTDSLYFPLFQYFLPAGKVFSSLDDDGIESGMESLYTPTNVAHRLVSFDLFLKQDGVSQETIDFIGGLKKDMLENQDKGYVVYHHDGEFFPELVGKEDSPKHVYILSDINCGSSGDNFVDTLKMMPKVTVVGRPTLGILDYSNCALVDFDQFEMIHPTSRNLCVDSGNGMNDIGVLPDIEILWTPDMIHEDKDLALVMDLIEKGEIPK